MSHVPDLTRIPEPLRGLNWLPMDDYESATYEDGTRLLVAVPIVVDPWYYDLAVVVVRCDEESFRLVDTNGETWTWSLDDVDWFVVIDGRVTAAATGEAA